MFGLIDYVAFAIALVAGVGLGRAMNPRPPKPPKPLRPICSCDHGLGSHDEGWRCHGMVEEPSRYDSYGEPTAWQRVQCTCLRYDGPSAAVLGIDL